MLPLPSSAARRTLAAIVAALAPRSPPALASTTAPLHLLPSCNKIAGAGPLLRGSSRASFRVCASSTIVPLEARLFSPFVFIPSGDEATRRTSLPSASQQEVRPFFYTHASAVERGTTELHP